MYVVGKIFGHQATDDNSYEQSKSRHIQVGDSGTGDIQMISG